MSRKFDPKLVTLTDLYGDGFQDVKEIKVYENGKMQAAVYPTVTYDGSASDKDQVINYIQKNTTILYEDGANLVPVDWKKSFKSNGYEHVIISGSKQKTSARNAPLVLNIRTPFYFTVPKYSAGRKNWVARLDDVTTSTKTPLVVDVVQYTSAKLEDVEIADLQHFEKAEVTARILRYKHGAQVPTGHHLFNYIGHDGIKFGFDNVWIIVARDPGPHKSALGGFLGIRNNYISFYSIYHYYWGQYKADTRIEPFKDPDKNLDMLTQDPPIPVTGQSSVIGDAWKEGIVMAMAQNWRMRWKEAQWPDDWSQWFLYEIEGPYLIEDNYGNEFHLTIDWGSNDKWKPTKFELA